jgi:hypothetical protein
MDRCTLHCSKSWSGELESLRAREDTVVRAKRLLETYSGRPPCLALALPRMSEA